MPNLWIAFFSSRINRVRLAVCGAMLFAVSIAIGYNHLRTVGEDNEIAVKNLNIDLQGYGLGFASLRIVDGTIIIVGTAPSSIARDQAIGVILSRSLDLKSVPWRTLQIEDQLAVGLDPAGVSFAPAIKTYSLSAPSQRRNELFAGMMFAVILGSVFGYRVGVARISRAREKVFQRMAQLTVEHDKLAEDQIAFWRQRFLLAQTGFREAHGKPIERDSNPVSTPDQTP